MTKPCAPTRDNSTPCGDGDLKSAAGARWADALAKRYPGPHKAKRIATDLGRDLRTVTGWLRGQPPHLSHAIDAANTLADPLLLVELTGLPVPTNADVSRTLTEIRRDLNGLDQRLAKLSGGRFGAKD